MYANGRGVQQDDAEAVTWYRKAIDQGAAEAQLSLGFMYAEGRGVQQDDAEAVVLALSTGQKRQTPANVCIRLSIVSQ